MIPRMPKDWWPDRIMVTGSHAVKEKRVEVAFVMSDLDSGEQHIWECNLETLREALWHAIHSEETV